MAYALPSDLAARFDERVLKDLASDTGEPVDSIHSDARILAVLADASGRIESALTVSRMYSAADLAALTGNSLSLLKRMTCELAMGYLMSRRTERFGSEDIAKTQKEAEEYLDRLRKGERVFGAVAAALDAGLPETDGPTTTDYTRLNLIPDRTRNFYPARSRRLPTDRN